MERAPYDVTTLWTCLQVMILTLQLALLLGLLSSGRIPSAWAQAQAALPANQSALSPPPPASQSANSSILPPLPPLPPANHSANQSALPPLPPLPPEGEACVPVSEQLFSWTGHGPRAVCTIWY